MSERIRFHLDENVNPVIAVALRQHGIDVSTTVGAGLRSSNDFEQLTYANREGRVLVTHDADFLGMVKEISEHAGIAYCHKEARTIGEIIRSLILIYEVLILKDMRNHIEFL